MSTSTDLQTLVSQHLEDDGQAILSDSYDGTETAPPLFYRWMPAEPDEAILVTAYAIPGAHRYGVQVRVRGSASSTVSASDRADNVRHALHGLADITVGGTTLVLLAWKNTAPMGFDANGREELALNFTATTSDPGDSLVDIA